MPPASVRRLGGKKPKMRLPEYARRDHQLPRLHRAARRGDVAAIRELLGAGAAVGAVTNWGDTVLD